MIRRGFDSRRPLQTYQQHINLLYLLGAIGSPIARQRRAGGCAHGISEQGVRRIGRFRPLSRDVDMFSS